MSGNFPFGFSGGSGDDESGSDNPFGSFDPANFDPNTFDMSQIGAALAQLGQMLQSGGSDPSPVNWELARDTARKIVVGEGDGCGTGCRYIERRVAGNGHPPRVCLRIDDKCPGPTIVREMPGGSAEVSRQIYCISIRSIRNN